MDELFQNIENFVDFAVGVSDELEFAVDEEMQLYECDLCEY